MSEPSVQKHGVSISEGCQTHFPDCRMSSTAVEFPSPSPMELQEAAARDSVRRQMRWLMLEIGIQQEGPDEAQALKRSDASGGGLAAVRAKEVEHQTRATRAPSSDPVTKVADDVADLQYPFSQTSNRMSILELASSRRRLVRCPSLPSKLSRGAELNWLHRDRSRPLPLQDALSDALEEISSRPCSGPSRTRNKGTRSRTSVDQDYSHHATSTRPFTSPFLQ